MLVTYDLWTQLKQIERHPAFQPAEDSNNPGRVLSDILHDLIRYAQHFPIPMDPSRLRTWIWAMRSGQYKKGRNALCPVDRNEPGLVRTNCCLGVIGDLYLPGVWTFSEHNQRFDLVTSAGHSSTFLQDRDFLSILDRNTSFPLPTLDAINKVQRMIGLVNDNSTSFDPVILFLSIIIITDGPFDWNSQPPAGWEAPRTAKDEVRQLVLAEPAPEDDDLPF